MYEVTVAVSMGLLILVWVGMVVYLIDLLVFGGDHEG